MPERNNESASQTGRQTKVIAQWRFSELIALGVVCALGIVILVIHLATWGAQARREAKFDVPTRCVVERVVARARKTENGLRFRPEITIRYEVNGESFTTTTYDRLTLTDDQGFELDERAAIDALEPFDEGRVVVGWSQPDDPTQIVLVKRSTIWGWIFLIIPTLLILSGGSLLISRLYDRLFSEEAKANAKRRETAYPSLPIGGRKRVERTNGIYYRLVPDAKSTFSFGAAAFGAIVWNVASWSLFLYVLYRADSFNDRLCAWIFFAVFCGVGLVFALRLMDQYRIARLVGSISLEVSAFPILPGRKVKLNLPLRGRIQAKRLDVFLKCEEIARFSQGTNTIVHRREVYSKSIFTKFGVDVPAKSSEVERFTALAPVGAMHSFSSEHNEIVWKFVARLEFADGGTFSRDFEITVMPFAPRD
ncbi:MAG: hypothetical protein IJU03_13280 [Thermoguttaceae bacterium]|nr:hypothetical protein [Thermoguttaceae bacterium]